jgi:multidrug efflux pump subunit AcrB
MAGFIPLILGGGGFWPPLAVVIAGGVGGATILALYFIPPAYLLWRAPSDHLKTRGVR